MTIINQEWADEVEKAYAKGYEDGKKILLEAIEQLQEFFQADMWYAKELEWRNKKDMLKYINGHFDICKKAIKKIQSEDCKLKNDK